MREAWQKMVLHTFGCTNYQKNAVLKATNAEEEGSGEREEEIVGSRRISLLRVPRGGANPTFVMPPSIKRLMAAGARKEILALFYKSMLEKAVVLWHGKGDRAWLQAIAGAAEAPDPWSSGCARFVIATIRVTKWQRASRAPH